MGMDKFRRTHQVNGPLTVGYDDTGYDVNFYGATSGSKVFWDESADDFQVQGTMTITGSLTLGGAARVYKYIDFAPADFNVADGNAALGVSNSLYPALLLTAAESGSTDVVVYPTWVPAPADIDTSACMNAYYIWCSDTATASLGADMEIAWKFYGDGEATPLTTGSTDDVNFRATASDAFSPTTTLITDEMDVPAVGDLMGFTVTVNSGGSGTAGSDFQLLGVRIRYTALGMGAAT